MKLKSKLIIFLYLILITLVVSGVLVVSAKAQSSYSFGLKATNRCFDDSGYVKVELSWKPPKGIDVVSYSVEFRNELWPDHSVTEWLPSSIEVSPNQRSVLLPENFFAFSHRQFRVATQLINNGKIYSEAVPHYINVQCPGVNDMTLINSILLKPLTIRNFITAYCPQSSDSSACTQFIGLTCPSRVANGLRKNWIWVPSDEEVFQSMLECAQSKFPRKLAASDPTEPAADSAEKDKAINDMCSDNRPGYTKTLQEECMEKSSRECMAIEDTKDFNSCVEGFKNTAISQIKPNFINRVPDFWGIVGAQCHYILGNIVTTNARVGDLCEVASRPCGTKEAPDSSYEELVQEATTCIQEKAKTVNYSATRAPVGAPTGTSAQSAPAAAPRAPSVPTAQTPAGYNTDFDKHVYAWCSSANSVLSDKTTACNSETVASCTSQTDEEAFKRCVQKIARDKYGGLYNPEKQSFAPPAQEPPEENQAQALVRGQENIGELPADTIKIDIAGKVFKKGDSAQKCLIEDVELILVKTTDENGNQISPPKSILSTKTQNCQPYQTTLQGAGHYQLTVSLDKAVGSQSFDVAKTTPKQEVEIFNCETKAQVAGNTISAAVNVTSPNPTGDFLGYDRAEWFTKKGLPTPKDHLAYNPTYKKGDNCQFAGKGAGCLRAEGHDPTIFEIEPNQDYYIQAVAYPVNGTKKSVACTFVGPLRKSPLSKANNTQVLGETSEDLSQVTTTMGLAVSSEGISSVVIRAIGYDGQPLEALYEDQIIGDQVINYTVNNLSQVDKVETVVIPENGGPQTIIQDLPDLTNVPASTSPIQTIELVQNPQGDQFTKDDSIDLIAVTSQPVTDPSFINTENNQQYQVENQDKQEKCASLKEQKCVYTAHLWAGVAQEGKYKMKFAASNQVLDDNQVLEFTIGEEAQISSPTLIKLGIKVATKKTISKDSGDGSDKQIVYLVDPACDLKNVEDCQISRSQAEFSLQVGPNVFKYTIFYNFSETDKEDFLFSVTRTAGKGNDTENIQTSTETPASTPETTVNSLQECPFADLCPDDSYRTCVGTVSSDDGQCHYSDTIGVRCERECSQPNQDSATANCRQEARDLGNGCAQNYDTCTGENIGNLYDINTGEECSI